MEATMEMDLAGLRRCSLDELEALYRTAPVAALERRVMRGEVLARVRSRFAGSPWGALSMAPFEALSWGVDFQRERWFFGTPRVGAGRFRVEPGRSRWRDTETLRLRYDRSRLPIKSWLYDEVKPLGPGLALGLGGVEVPSGDGAVFFFALRA
jgi:hypothetical protein